jgi:hypothetical protein
MLVGRNARIIMSLAAIAVMLMFSEMRAATLFATIAGAVLVMLGLVTFYRPASVIGLMITAAAEAISNNPGSLTSISSVLNAVFGLLLPLYVLAWVSLSSGSEVPSELRTRSRASAITILFMLACALSVPVTALALGLVSPRFSMSISMLTEIAVVLGVATTGIILLTAQTPKRNPTAQQGPGTSTEEG